MVSKLGLRFCAKISAGGTCLLTPRENKIVELMTPSTKANYYLGFRAPRTRQLGVYINNNGFDKNDLEELTIELSLFCISRWKV
jgi:hypothetical protein